MARGGAADGAVTLAALAELLGPAEVIDAGRAWTVIPEAGKAVVWGRPPAPSGTNFLAATRHAARREAALRRLPAGASVTRWLPPDLGGAGPRAAARDALLAGAIAEIDRPRERLIDSVAAAAGTSPVREFRPASGGALLARVQHDGVPVLLRAGISGSPGDPAAGAAALEALDVPLAPRLLGRGAVGMASWSVETLLVGRRPRQLTERLWNTCVEVCAALPGAPTSEAPRGDLAAIAAAVPAVAGELDRAAAPALDRLDGLGGAARHGDLWRPNLLAVGGRLTGVVDWDAWHPAAAPGVDLLNLYAMERHAGLGAAFVQAPWRSPEFAAATRRYWERRGIDPAPADLDAIALAWWAGQAAASLRRLPHLAQSRAWVEANVDAVLRSL